ncbi:MAG: TolC family protein [Thermoanaerobaculia bacterium]
MRRARGCTRNKAAFATFLGLLAWAPLRAQTTLLTADEAVRRAIAENPELASAEQDVARRSAIVTEARSIFDSSVLAKFRVDYDQEELVGSRLKSEVNRRLQLEIPPPALDEAARRLRAAIPTNVSLLTPSTCLGAATLIVVGDAPTVLCLDNNGDLLGVLDPSLAVGATLFSAVSLADAFVGLEGLNGRIQLFADSLRATAADQIRLVADILTGTATALRIQRMNIGDLPRDRESILLDTRVDYRIPFHNGTALISSLALASSEDNFIDKPLDPLFGDSFVANQFRVTGGVALEIPLGQGGGRTSYSAPFVAAQQAEAAARSLYRHAASQRAEVALEAYWDVVAAKQRLALLETSLAQQDRLLDATQQLIDGDQLARIDIERNRAQRAATASSVASGRRALSEARAALAVEIGAFATEVDVIDTDSDFALFVDKAVEAALDSEAMVGLALAERDDVKAAEQRLKAESTLAAAAERDLRPQVDLRLNASYNAYHETFDTRFYEPKGFGDAFSEPWSGPSYGISMRFRLPIGNNVARGRLLQARSATTSSEIDSTELKRSVRLEVLEDLSTLAGARAELAERREARQRIQETAEATWTRYQAGDLTVLDTLITEQELTRAGLDLVGSERAVLSLVTRLRFASGRLVDLPADGDIRTARLLPLDSPLR